MDVLHVSVLPDFILRLDYANGEQRQFDMKPLLQMSPWNRIAAPERFEKAYIDYGTVVWPGNIDIAPETLYADSIPLPRPSGQRVSA
ncbi:hypothetical protein VZ95_07850 [Elstera litoralis]|uniref:DUF2442 domain-containing protein n=1 Tax=Elstera litoralis TaxID=552518 RepID=A0A0F3IWK5_9PROT|nr:DUF2442 domain-containing protein [Elstera litoralis]KJV09994.1 hypothetical protein VZ95_07850 [Elstera litoralis]